jgi:hypothetical protein
MQAAKKPGGRPGRLGTLETTKRVLGQEHPNTLRSMHNLASTYQSQGWWKETEELKMQVMETSSVRNWPGRLAGFRAGNLEARAKGGRPGL